MLHVNLVWSAEVKKVSRSAPPTNSFDRDVLNESSCNERYWGILVENSEPILSPEEFELQEPKEIFYYPSGSRMISLSLTSS